MKLTYIEKGEVVGLPIREGGMSCARMAALTDLVLVSEVLFPVVIPVKDLEAIGFSFIPENDPVRPPITDITVEVTCTCDKCGESALSCSC